MILAIETSDVLCSVVFWDKGRSILEYNLELPQQHATLVGSLVEKGLDFLAAPERVQTYTQEDIELVVSSIGPGSFTGLRIGLSFAQGFCSGNATALVGVSNHQVLAAQRLKSIEPVFTMIEARRNEVYLAEHEWNSVQFPQIRTHEIVSKTDLPEALPEGAQLICTVELKLEDAVREALVQKKIFLLDTARFSANYLAALGAEKIKIAGADDPATLEPMYIRPFAGAQ